MLRIVHPILSNAQLQQSQIIELRKRLASIDKEARANAKHPCCLLCGKKVDSFCNSHTIPQMCLSRIATKGKLNSIFSFSDCSVFDPQSGVNNSGTFFLICNDCDNKYFKKYENPQSYISDPGDDSVLLNQIALKNILKVIYKHEIEIEKYKIALRQADPNNPFINLLLDQQIAMREIDLQECYSAFDKCKENITSGTSWLYTVISEKLDYVTPIAFQGMIAITTGFDSEVINNKFTDDTSYHLEYLHLAVLPIQNQTVVLLFMDKANKRHDKFIRRLQKQPKTKKVQLINYLLFLYCEDYYFSEQLSPKIIGDLKEKAKSYEDTLSTNPTVSLKQAIEDYDLRNAWKTQNVLGIHIK